jgi:hypothetical protein
VIFYGLADHRLADSELGEVVEFFASRDEADEALQQVLVDEPEWRGELGVVEVELGGLSRN